jgi:hypothetical protein
MVQTRHRLGTVDCVNNVRKVLEAKMLNKTKLARHGGIFLDAGPD